MGIFDLASPAWGEADYDRWARSLTDEMLKASVEAGIAGAKAAAKREWSRRVKERLAARAGASR